MTELKQMQRSPATVLFVVLTIYLASHFDVFTFSASSLIHCDDTLHRGGVFETSKPFGSHLIPRNRKMRMQGIQLGIALLHIAISGKLGA